MYTHKQRIAELMGAEKYVIACAHFIPLPGSTGYDRQGGMKKIIDRALRDTRILLDNGVTSILFVNEADIPFYERIPREGLAAFTAVVNTALTASMTQERDFALRWPQAQDSCAEILLVSWHQIRAYIHLRVAIYTVKNRTLGMNRINRRISSTTLAMITVQT